MNNLAHDCRELHQQARVSFQKNDINQAILFCRQLNERYPNFDGGWFLASQISLRLGNLDKALEFANQASDLTPNEPLYNVHKANCLVYVRRFEEALTLAKRMEKTGTKNANLLAGLATVFTGCGDHISALRCNQQATEISPTTSGFHYNLAATQRFLGQLDEAEESYNKTIELDPHEYEAYLMRSELHKRTVNNNYVSDIRSRIDKGVKTWQGKVQLYYALAKELEDLEDFENAFRNLKQGADLKRQHTQYDVGVDIVTIDQIIELFDKATLQKQNEGFGSAEPIFILGLPRTGTTLVERILSCHEKVTSAGELNNFAIELVKMAHAQAGSTQMSRSELLEASTKIDFSQLGENYVKGARPRNCKTPFFIDKLPANYLYCGLIHLALPKARIIKLVRNPMDACYAMYKTLFKSAYPFSYDIEELANYFVAYKKLMDHWQVNLPEQILEVHYEDLISHQEDQSRRILEFCDLEWDPKVLDFHQSKEASMTASASQIRKPIYATSIGKWKKMQKQLEPMLKILKPNGVKVD